METTKKTSTTKAALLVLAALSMLLSGLFIATASSSDAQDASCPAGFTLNAAGTECSQASSVTTFDAGNSCVAPAYLSQSGANCWVAATATAQAGTTTCPAGFSANASNVCAANSPATASAAACVAGASGTPTAGCYTTVSTVTTPVAATCSSGTVSGTLCQVSTTAGAASDVCTNGTTVDATYNTLDTPASVIADCYSSVAVGVSPVCATTATQGVAAPGNPNWTNTALCYTAGVVTAGTGVGCPSTSQLAGANCISFTSAGYTAGSAGTATCPAGSLANGTGGCRVVAAVAATTYSCAAGTLNVSAATPPVYTCDTSTGFSATAGGVLYSCAAGTPAVVGADILCDLGAATSGVTTGPSCAQGVLSADAASCVVAVAAPVAAPVPAFTG